MSSLKLRGVASLSLVASIGIVVACSSTPAPVTVSVNTDGGNGGPPPGDAGMTMTPEAAAPVATGPTFFTGDSGSAPATAPTGTAAPAMTDQMLDTGIDVIVTTAQPKVAPKMDHEGTPGHQTMKEGDHFVMMVTLSPNRCYTFVGAAAPLGVTQLDLKLYGPPFYTVEAGKSSPADKTLPVIGKGTTALCPILPIAVPYKLDAVATKGAGRVGIHVFARNK